MIEMAENMAAQYLIDIKCKSALDPQAITENTVDLIITSPPYNVGKDYTSNEDNLSYDNYLNFTEQWLSNCLKWVKHSGRICINVPLDKNKFGKNSVGADVTMIAQDVGWQYHTTIIWNEQNISRRTAWGSWLSASAPYVIAPVELIIVLSKGQWKKNYKGISDIDRDDFMAWTNGLWTFNGESAKRVGHPAPFPRELPKRCIKLFSYVEDTVLDPFLGSGTTLIEAISNKRYGIGLEIDKDYIKNSHSRIASKC